MDGDGGGGGLPRPQGGREGARGRRIDVRWAVRAAVVAGAALAWLLGLVVGRVLHQDQWESSAASATAAWVVLVALAVALAATVQTWRRGPRIEAAGPEPSQLRAEWLPPLILVAGVLLGWWLFK